MPMKDNRVVGQVKDMKEDVFHLSFNLIYTIYIIKETPRHDNELCFLYIPINRMIKYSKEHIIQCDAQNKMIGLHASKTIQETELGYMPVRQGCTRARLIYISLS